MGGRGPGRRGLLRGIRVPRCLVPLHRPVAGGRRRGHGQGGGGRWRRREGRGSGAVGVLRVLQRPRRLPLEGRLLLLIGGNGTSTAMAPSEPRLWPWPPAHGAERTTSIGPSSA